MYFPADPHTAGIMTSQEELDGMSGGNKRPRLSPEERRERDRERTRRYRMTLSEERKKEIRDIQRMKVAERRYNFSEDKRNFIRMQNAKRARERRAERKMAMVLAGVHTEKYVKRPSKRSIGDKRTRALEAVREATAGLFEPLVPTLGKARASRAAAAAAAAAAATTMMLPPNLPNNNAPHSMAVGLSEGENHLLDLDMDDDMNQLPHLSHQLPVQLSSVAANSLLSGASHAHHVVMHGQDTDSEDENGMPLRPAVLPMAGIPDDFDHDVNSNAVRGKKRKNNV